MPGKQDTEFFPLDLNTMNGGIGYYGEVSPILIPHRHHGKFDASVVHHGSPIAMALHNSPVNATLMPENLMSEYINANGLPPVNSEDEEEDDDDIVSQSGSESVSVQGSDIDLDVEVMDDMDSLVLNIRDKLRMAAPQYSLHHHNHHLHSASEYWTDSPSATSTPNSIHSTSTDNDLLILSPASVSNSTGTGGIGGSNCSNTTSSSMGSKSNSSSSNSKNQRKRRGPLSRSSNLQQWRHSHPNATNSYYKQFNSKHGGSISKSSKKNYQSSHWWSTRPYGDLSQQSRPKDAYELLQELIHSGSLIKEAVRRLNRKCLSTSNGSTISSNSSSNQEPITPSNSTASLVVSSTKFSYLDEESSDASFSSHHHPSLHLSAPCN